MSNFFFLNFLKLQHTQQQVFCKTQFHRKWHPDYRNLSPFSWWALHVVMNNWLTQTVGVEHRNSQENIVWGKVYLLISSVFFLGCVWEKAEINRHLLQKTQPIFRLVKMHRVDQDIIQWIILNYYSSSCLILFSAFRLQQSHETPLPLLVFGACYNLQVWTAA